MPSSGELLTPRLAVRPPSEADRDRFVELFGDEAFMVFSSGPLTNEASHRRFEHMLAVAEVVFAKQPVVERGSGLVIGYTGVDYFEFENETRLGWGYRIAPEFRGRGYATEARGALLELAGGTFTGELLAIIDPLNHPSQNVCRKVGFTYWKEAFVDGEHRNLYTLRPSTRDHVD